MNKNLLHKKKGFFKVLVRRCIKGVYKNEYQNLWFCSWCGFPCCNTCGNLFCWHNAAKLSSGHSLLLSLCSHSMRMSNCCCRLSCRREPPLCYMDCEMVLWTCVEWCPGEHQPVWCSLGGMMMVDAPRWEIHILVKMELQTGTPFMWSRLWNGVAELGF
jgi:hypothetical protein